MSMVTVAMVAPPITPTPAAIPPPRHVSLFEFSASTPPQTSPKSSWFSPNNGRAEFFPTILTTTVPYRPGLRTAVGIAGVKKHCLPRVSARVSQLTADGSELNNHGL